MKLREKRKKLFRLTGANIVLSLFSVLSFSSFSLSLFPLSLSSCLDEVRTIEFKTNKIVIPSVDTTYWCSIHKFPEAFREKQHIVRYESVIQPGNEQLVHHMELFHCEVPVDQVVPAYNGPCTGPQTPPILSRCRKVVAAWAMGAAVGHLNRIFKNLNT